MAKARIYRPAKTAMQSGRLARKWIVEFEPQDRKNPDALMGWVGSRDTLAQLKLKFDTQEEAVAYAKREGLDYVVVAEAPKTAVKPKNYADNFAFNRIS
jgi:hypothetical protein